MTHSSPENATCYVERSAVRQILIGSNVNNEDTNDLLQEVDALPIFTAAELAAIQPQRMPEHDEPREPTPHWQRRWPHDHPNGWNLDSAGFLKLIQENPLMWLALGRAKYLEMRIDARDGGFNLYDRDKKPLNPDDVIEAINKVRADFGKASLTRPERGGAT